MQMVSEHKNLYSSGGSSNIVSNWPGAISLPGFDKGADLTLRKEGEERLNLSEYPFRQVMGKLMYLPYLYLD